MSTSRRKAANNPRGEKPPKKRIKDDLDDEEKKKGSIQVPELYRMCVTHGDKTHQRDNIRMWEERGALGEIVWPFLVGNVESKDFFHACHLLVLFVSHHSWEGAFSSSSIPDCMQQGDVIEKVLETLLYKTDAKDYALQTQIVHFILVALLSDNSTFQRVLIPHVSGVRIWHYMPERRRELELKNSAGLRRKFAETEKSSVWIVANILQILNLLEGHSSFGLLLRIHKEDEDADSMTMDVPADVWNFLHRSLELMIDLLSVIPTRLSLVSYLDSIHFSVRCRLAVGNHFALPENLRLVQQLLGRINRLLSFPIQDSTQKHLSKVDVVSMYHARATTLQKIAYRHYSRRLQPVIYAGVGLLCARQQKHSYLERSFAGFPEEDLRQLLHRLRLIDAVDKTVNQDFMLQILAYHLAIPPYPMDQLKSFPLYPTESILWDHNLIPPSSSMLRSTTVLALPKLNRQFLSYQDYLLRNFELVRLESAYEIRSDLVHVMKRVRPLLRQSNIDESEDIQLKTEFSGWSRMALELAKPLDILEVQPPKLGETISSRITAEIVIDLELCGESIRNEWKEIGEHDNLFLVAVDASKMSGNPAPLLKDFHLRHGAHKQWDSDNGERRIPDEEDSTFPQRFGVTLVRGCMVLQVRNEGGAILSDPGVAVPPSKKGDTKRIFKVALDPAQYSLDSRSPGGTEVYQVSQYDACSLIGNLFNAVSLTISFFQQLNLVVRRHGRENNFKSVLETIRGLMEGAGSISRVIPPWLQSVLLGSGDAHSASYKSDTIKAYATKTVGVNKPNDFLDYGDTFLDEGHLRASFTGKVIVDGREKLEADEDGDPVRCNYKVRMVEEEATQDNGGKLGVMEAKSFPFPSGVNGNPVRFTRLQVEAIRSGLSPGLTMVVGPPGTGKTDVAVQIISSLYHSFPTQRTIIITHSNAALNDIFQKVMARGDVDERYLVRLGAGERDLKTDSSHDFTKIGRVAYSLERRGSLLEEVQLMSESLGISGKAERGGDGSPAYTCETADYFRMHSIEKMKRLFNQQLASGDEASSQLQDRDVASIFPFANYFKTENRKVTLAEARKYFSRLDEIFNELAEYRPFELLRSQRQRADYLIMKQARIVAMTCTHAAIVRSHLIELGFEYDNIVMEEAGQMMEIETFIPMLLQRGESDDSVAGLSRLKRVCMMGDHNQLPPVVKNASFSKFSNLDQSLFSRLIRLGVPYIQLDKQGRARAELARLYRYVVFGSLSLPPIRLSHQSRVFSSLPVGVIIISETFNMLWKQKNSSLQTLVLLTRSKLSTLGTFKVAVKQHLPRSFTKMLGRRSTRLLFFSIWY
jgi:intron-binding protein aquarius